jgi:formylglycine-generating enzyme required for sulfatase activity
MKLVLIPAGKFTMGSPKGEKGRSVEEKEHEVTLTRAFYLGACEVTQAQFRKIMDYNPSFFSKDGRGKEGLKYEDGPAGGKDEVKGMDTVDFPVENVSWDEAVRFCQKLTARAEEKGRGRVYRLPSEAEWEYACRGGPGSSTKPFHFKFPSDSLGFGQANFQAEYPYGAGKKGKGLGHEQGRQER